MMENAAAEWTALERRLAWPGLEAFARAEILPALEAVPVEERDRKGQYRDSLERVMLVGGGLFTVCFIALAVLLPNNFWGVALRFIMFFPLFFGSFALSIWLYRERIADVMMRGRDRFLARSAALSKIAERLDLAYVPMPGGAPYGMKWLAERGWMPRSLREVTELLDAHGGLDEAVEIARRSGTMLSNLGILGTPEQRERLREQHARNQQAEDGFSGTRGGVAFTAFEWIESVSEAPDIYHLTLVFEAPMAMQGVTQLRTRKAAWPGNISDREMRDVDIVWSEFRERFRLRSTDQTEARAVFDPAVIERAAGLAHGEKLCAVAFETHLVVDVAGDDRFNLIDLATGERGEDRLRQCLTHIADMLDLADAVGGAFRLGRAGAA